MPFVVVMLSDECEHYEGHECVLRVCGPYACKEDAVEVFEAARAAGERPHAVSLTAPDGSSDSETAPPRLCCSHRGGAVTGRRSSHPQPEV